MSTCSGLLLAACLQSEAPREGPPPVSERFADMIERPPPERLQPAAAEPAAASSSPETAPAGESPGEPAAKIVARLELSAPATSRFLLRATLPVPRDLSASGSGQPLLGITSHDRERSLVPAQLEIVTRSPSGEPEVVEILAPVELAPAEKAGARVRYAVVDLRARAQPVPRPGFMATERVAGLLAPDASQPFLLRTRDVFDNTYAVELGTSAKGPGFGSRTVLKDGPWLRQTRLAAVLVPVERSGNGEPLPHLMGVHAYLTEIAGFDRLVLDVRVHNGLGSAGRAPEPEELPAGIVYWKSLELVLPSGWSVEPFVADPFFGPPRGESGQTIVPIVRANDDGSLHMMGPQMQFHRRLVLRPESHPRAPAAGRAFLEGLAFPVSEPELWSWIVPEMACYFPQHAVLARWEGFARSGNAGVAGLRAWLAGEFDGYARLVERGEANGDDVVATVMGWAHPWFYKYGGTTGGASIQFFEGHAAAGAASSSGYGWIALVHQMNASRQDEAAWTKAGEPAGYEAWVDRAADRVPIDFRTHGGMLPRDFQLPAHGGPPASEQVLEVHRRGLRPSYDQGAPHEPNGEYPSTNENLVAWAAHDGQHMIRYTKNAKALVWLGNDSLAKDDLRLSAELFHLQFHESAGPSPSAVTLRAFEQHAAAFPHQGAWLGRDQAWGIDSMCAAYATATPEWRAAHLDWFRRVASVLDASSMPSGVVQRNSNPKVLGHGGYDASQTFETEFLLHAMRCMNETVFRGVDEEIFERLASLVRRTVDYVFFGPVWREDPGRDPDGPLVGGPRTGFAVALSDGFEKPPFSDVPTWGEGYLPDDGIASGPELFYGWQALEYAALLSQETEGAGLENRYLLRSLRYGSIKRDFPMLVQSLWSSTMRRTTDGSSSWIGFAGYLQSLMR